MTDSATPAQPRTAAGRALLEAISHLSSDLPMVFGDEAMELLDIEATAQTILAIEAQAAPPDALREALGGLVAMLPQADEYAYIEARVGSDNFRRETHFVVDRRGHPIEGKREYTNEMANDWLAKVAEAADGVRAALAAAPAALDAHKPGDHHDYRVECVVCGQRGMLNLSVEPQRVAEPNPTLTYTDPAGGPDWEPREDEL